MYEESGYVIVQRYSNWQKKKVRTIVVNAHAKTSSQKSIAGAISLAKPYDRIELTGGEYNESIAIQMPLELVAAEGEDPHLSSRSSTVTLTTAGIDVYMEHLSVSSRSTSKMDAAVVAVNGNPILYRCQCTSLLIGGNAVAHVDECTIKDSSSGVGIVVQDSAGGLIKSTNVRTHRNSCVEIDTRGELAVTECIIDNNIGGDAMVISGAMSSVGRDGSAPHTSCSHVEVLRCHFTVVADMDNDGHGTSPGGSPLNVTGDACCIVLTQGAAPTIASNELTGGEIGILIEGPGTAQLKGNLVCCQRRCGILALVDEGAGYVQGHETLRITGDNVLDRCRIGIDVQCAVNRSAYIQQTSPVMMSRSPGSDAALLPVSSSPLKVAYRVLTDELPNPKRAFSWTPVQGGGPPTFTAEAASFPPSPVTDTITSSAATDNALICMEGEWYPLNHVKANLQQLVQSTLQTYPTCLQPSFGIMSGTALTVGEGMSAPSANPFIDILNSMLGTHLSSKKEASPHVREMLQLRGNKGVDIINTKFSNCDVCAIRFGRQGYGLVEECVFEDCGTFAIVVDCAAHPLITGCRFLRSRGASILVNNFANPLIIGNEMVSGKRDGIQLSRMSRGLIIGNIITTHVGVGIQVGEHSQPLICANAISQNRKGGVAVANGSRPTILLNGLSANLTAQIYCTAGSDAFICRNRITASADAGIRIDACSRGTVLSNTLHANGEGILVELDADPYVQGNDVVGSLRAGIQASNNALGSYVGNRLSKNIGPNVLVSEGASPVFRGNRIEGSPQGGVVVLNEGRGFFEHNTMTENGVANVLVVGTYSEPTFAHNVMYGSRPGCGVICVQNAGGTFTNNRIYENSQCGVYIADTANPTFSENNVAREAVGVLLSDGGKGTLTTNVIEECYGCGVLSQRRAHPTFSNNTVTRCQMSGLQVAPDSLGVFTANELTHNDVGVHVGSSLESAVVELHSMFLVDTGSDRHGSAGEEGSPKSRSASATASRRPSSFPTQTDKGGVLHAIASTVEQRRASAARATLSVIADNVISHNVSGGVLLDSFPNATVENNDIFENNAYGVRGDCAYTTARAQAVLREELGIHSASVVQTPQQRSLFAQLQTLTVIRTNKIHAHGEANILLDHFDGEQNATSLTRNAIYDAPHGVCVVNNSTAQEVRENDIYNCVDGVCCSSGGRGHFFANHIHHCTYSGVYVAAMANPEFHEKNEIEQCGFAGVLVDVGGQGMFRENRIRHCRTGVVVFCGPATPFQLSYDEVVKARLVSASPTFTSNTIEENELHGVLLLSVITGSPLRTLLALPSSHTSRQPSLVPTPAAASIIETAAHDTPSPYLGMDSATVGAREGRLRAMFEKNLIQRNRVMGVYHDRFEHWDLAALDNAHAERKTPNSGNIKNAYGGYEILLGTSQVLDHADHRRQRQLKQVSFVGNTITECSIGFGAGYGCHPYLEQNKICKNTFFGLLLRFGSAVSATGNDIRENGLAGVYAASGSKGYIANGAIEANNGWCRPEAALHEPRSFRACIFNSSFFSPESVRDVEENLLATPTATSSVQATRRAYEQMTHLAVVLTFTMADALRHLAELVAASSAGLTLATYCVPAAHGSFAAAPPRGVNGSVVSGRLGGVELPDYTEVCTADGGIGVWIQSGSRVSICANRIAGHTNSGVRVSRGVLQHHRVLHKAFHMEQPKQVVGNKLEMLSKMPGNTKVIPQTVGDQPLVDVFAMDQYTPALATTEPGALFTAQTLCVTGILAAVQVAASATVDSLNASFGSFSPLTMPVSPSYTLAANEERENRLDSIHHALVADNIITGNKDGIWLEICHTLQAVASADASPRAGVKGNSAFMLPSPSAARRLPMITRSTIHGVSANGAAGVSSSSTAMANAAGAASAATVCLPAASEDTNVMDSSFSGFDFSTIVEGNRISQNRRYGVYAMHVSKIKCGNCLANRGVLKDAVDTHHEKVRSQLILGKQNVPVEVRLPFELRPVKHKIAHALLRKNDLSGNERAQAFVTTRQVVLTQDDDRTLLQMDTTATPSASFYASQVLVGVPLYSALLQMPPPGVLLWDENRFHDARCGVRLCGQLGPHSTRFQRNTFVNIAGDAFLVEGHLACATVGNGNVFDGNGVSFRVSQQQVIRLVTVPAHASASRTRVFQNTFKAATDSSILLDSVGTAPPLLYRNEFSGQSQGSAALYLQSDNASGAAAVVQGNVFADSHVPVFIVGRSESGVESALSTSRILLLENSFIHNVIGAFVCNGAYPVMERNLFHANARAGLEVVGNGTRPQVRHCIFRGHTRTADGDSAATSAPTSRGRAIATTTTVVAPPSAEQRALVLPFRNLYTTLLPANARVLRATTHVHLPAGLLVGPFAEPRVENCGFVDNDVGVDAVRNAVAPSLAVTGFNATFKDCMFANNAVCGVLVRGLLDVAEGKGGRGSVSSSGSGATTSTSVGSLAVGAAGARLPDIVSSADGSPAETTIFERCVFADNATADGRGDVVAMDEGHAVFRNNIFGGTVVGHSGAVVLFSQNRFLGPLPADNGGEDGALVDAKHTSDVAIVIQEGGRIVADRNTILRRLIGVKCMPGAEGAVKSNRIVQCVTGLMLAPFNRTDVSKNRVLGSGECGAIAYGGCMADNEIVQSPVGIIVRHSSSYNGINAVPSHKRDTLGFLCCRNTITGCTGNGILISTTGTFDRNNVSHCKTGVDIVCPIGGGPAEAPPTLKNSSVFDNATGILMENDSESTVKDNDVFDNEVVGVLVLPNATGVLQGNRISSAMEQNAAEIPTEARVKSTGNVIRNQFSPAFQRGTRFSRAKQYQSDLTNLSKEFDEVLAAMEEARQEAASTVGALQTLRHELVEMYSRSITDSAATLAGSAGSALRNAAASAAPAAKDPKSLAPSSLHGTSAPRDVSSSSGASGGNAEKGNDRSNTDQLGNSPMKERRRLPSAAGRRSSLSLPSTHKTTTSQPRGSVPIPVKATAPLRGRAAALSQPASSASAAVPRQVLIHVFAKAEARGNAGAVGQVITSVLAKPPLSSYNFITTITTSTSQLLHVLESPSTQPYLCVVVLDAHLDGMSPSDCYALQQLHDCATPNAVSRYRSSAVHREAESANNSSGRNGNNTAASLFYTLVPANFPVAVNTKTVADAGEGMSVEAYAAAHHLISYKSSVEEVLTNLHTQIADDLKRALTDASHKRSGMAVLGDSSEKADLSRSAMDGDGDMPGLPNRRISNEDAPSKRGSLASSKQPIQLTAEYVGTLFSQLTPEAFGFVPQNDGKRQKRRKSSLAVSGQGGSDEEDSGDRKEGRSSMRPPRPSVVSKTGTEDRARSPTARRRSSVVKHKPGRRASGAAKKS
ncbi:hypothetical protein ABB37_04298 [Leptomonas pyrrhocoris]|uniref:Right handed beta helix domain-containing protein n=1 Tax=Leptomonas pyrrhocoris TaxID=157538 RepID=A0A0M9G2G5_LEPPY|nr:hypothetical protein ABB37_04298 [Leptomonas pyrrhocoris]KPA80893.1 hypothetical protein ABB37_04298 [Leptomonas pyrrhocoris]|eukprot:XP_015659332.1 hypothetical protein ABB37_04298 [Leptomonas pyrrhocoris]